MALLLTWLRRVPGITWVLLAFIGLGTLYALLTPLFEISDELWHYPMVKTLADGHGLPVQDPAQPGPWRQEGSQPPLYYGLMALATFWIDTSDIDTVRWLNPHVDNGIITADRNNNILIHTYPETEWPWRGTVLAVRLIRLLSVLLGTLTVYFTYRLALELLPGQTAVALAAAAFTAFTPMFVFISASVNNDTLAIALAAIALWLMVSWVRQALPPPMVQVALMGLVLGGAALSKVSALGLWPLAGAALVYAYLRVTLGGKGRRGLVRRLVLALGVMFGLAALLSFWWFWRNYQLYGDWLGWNAFLATVGSRPTPATLEILWGERVGFMQAYWGLFGGVSVSMPDWVYLALNLMTGFAGLGLLLEVGRFSWTYWRSLARPWLALFDRVFLWAFPVGWVVLILIGLVRWTSLTWASQGRLIFPAISAISLLLIAGWQAWRKWWPRVVPALSWAWVTAPSVFLAGVAVAVPFTIIAPHYTPPPNLTAAQVEAITHPLQVDFGEMRLLGYDVQNTAVMPGGQVQLTLYWQSQVAMDRNWSVFLHLVDEAGVIVAQRDRYPGAGLLATSLLQPGQTWADVYVLSVPAVAYAPTRAWLTIGVYDLVDGMRLTASDGREAIQLFEVAVQSQPTPWPNAVQQSFGHEVRLLGYEVAPRVLRAGETFTLTLYWQAEKTLSINYAVFAHVRGEAQTLWAGRDAWPQNGAAPTSTWRVGQTITDTYTLTLDPATPSGQYPVEVGVYEAQANGVLRRLHLVTADGRMTDANYLDLAQIKVVP